MLLPNRHGSSDKYRYGFNGMEKDDELKGVGNSYDFGARMLDPRIGRWFSKDMRESKYPGLSPYHFGYNSPIITVDPDGNENIIVIAEETSEGGRFKYNFIEPAIRKMHDYIAKDKNEQTTLVIMGKGYSERDLKTLRKVASDAGAELVVINSSVQLKNYFNSKDIAKSKITEERKGDRITDVSIYGHGGKKGDIWIDYKGKDAKGFGRFRTSQTKAGAFDNADICIYTCNGATGSDEVQGVPNEELTGKTSVANAMAQKFKSKVTAFWGKSDYEAINTTYWNFLDKYINKKDRTVNGFSTNGSLGDPLPGNFGSGENYPLDEDGNKIPAKKITFDGRNKTN